MKYAIFLTLLLTSCAYNPQVERSNLDPAKYKADSEECNRRRDSLVTSHASMFGALGVMINRATDDPAHLEESDAARGKDGRKRYVDKCMSDKGYVIKEGG